MQVREDLRNIAIIAHVDHGKTTLVDQMLRQSGVFRDNQAVRERVMDSGELEREKGITILAKNTAVRYGDTKINIIDTPGHADFGGEVERVLQMVDGVLLLVDAYEGPMPQTRFVLRKAMQLGHRVVVVINKIDRPDARPDAVVDEVLDLLIELGAQDDQLDVPFLFASGRDGTASLDWKTPGKDLTPLFDAILQYIPAPKCDAQGPLQVLVSVIDYNDYVGRIGIGRIVRGVVQEGQEVILTSTDHTRTDRRVRLSALFAFEGLKRERIETAYSGDIIAMSGVEGINVGDTVCDTSFPEALPFVRIDEPTVVMTFSVNDSPLAGRDGKFVTTRHLRARLEREALSDVSLRLEDVEGSSDAIRVYGRGELSLSILIETMRRQGYEFQVSRPRVLFKEIDGVRCEPIERVLIDVPSPSAGTVIEKLGQRKGELTNMQQEGNRMRMEFMIPSRGLFGYRSEFLTDTRGEGLMYASFAEYGPYRGEIASRTRGALIAFEAGEAASYGLFNAQDRGRLFIGAGTQVYAGMIVGENARTGDIEVNVCKRKHLTSIRNSAGAEEALKLTPVREWTVEEALEWLGDDELLEVTPKTLRVRKRILDGIQRMRAKRREEGNGL
nr:translational GTPase TypA [bacterium]